MAKHTIDTITERRRARLESVLRRRQTGLTIVLENIWDPHNVSAILRSADAVGILTVYLLYTIESAPNLSRHGKQSSASAKKWLDVRLFHDVDACFSELRQNGFAIYASHLTEHSAGLHEIDFTRKTAIILGNEHRGVSPEACERSDGIYYIPMMGMVESLNVSVAAAVSLYEALRQRTDAGLYDTPQLCENDLAATLREWGQK
ncbi:MAG: RNA methyltransferase [Bacteroidetes bacterium]|nr:RNA methyltransferase [Bacteroidota bacterium]